MSILITGVNESIQVVLDAAPVANQLPCTASYADQGGLGGDNTVVTTGLTAVTLVASPAAGVARVINGFSIGNRDTATRTVTINKVISGTSYQVVKVTLLTGYQLYYENTGGWRVLDASGNFAELVTVSGGTLTSNQGTATTNANGWPVKITDGTNVLGTVANPVNVSGTFTALANATTNITQFGGNAVITGTGVSGVGIPRVTVSSDSFPATQPVSIAASVAVTGTFFQTTQPVSGTFFQGTQPVSLTTLPALTAGSAAIGSVSVSNFPASQAVTGTFFQGTQPVSIAGIVSENLTQVGGVAITQGMKASASSFPVVIASDQSPIGSTSSAATVVSSTTASSLAANLSVFLTSLKVYGGSPVLAAGQTFLTISDGGANVLLSFAVPVLTAAGNLYGPLIEFTDLKIPMTNAGNPVTAKLTTALTSGFISVVATFNRT